MRAAGYLLLLALFWSACRADADLPLPGEEPPYFSMLYAGDSLLAQTVVAGVADVYLFTEYAAGTDDVLTCSATFTEVQCPADTCPGRLRLAFRNAQLGSVVLAGAVFGPGERAFRTNAPQAGPTVYRTTLRADTVPGYSGFNWTFNMNAFAQGSPVTYDFTQPDSTQVNLSAIRTGGLHSTVQRRIPLSTPGPVFPQVDILVTPQGNAFRLEAIGSGPAITGILWSDGSNQPVHLQDSLAPVYSVTVTNAQGYTASARLEGLPADPAASLQTANFSTETTLITLPPDTLQLGTVSLEWTDPSGQIWRSDRGEQGAGTHFEVLESAPYELNEYGQKTWQMKVAFVCRLYNAQGQSRAFSGQGRIAVAYP